MQRRAAWPTPATIFVPASLITGRANYHQPSKRLVLLGCWARPPSVTHDQPVFFGLIWGREGEVAVGRQEKGN